MDKADLTIDWKNGIYDWSGANAWIFKHINALHGDIYDAAMLFFSSVGDHHHFPYYMALLAAFVPVSALVRRIFGKGGTKQYLAAWLGILLVLAAGYAVEGYAIKQVKEHFSYPRPYVALAHEEVRRLEFRDGEDYKSLPSGHVAFITLMVVGLWPMLSSNLRWLGGCLIFAVAWSRLAMGVHFPADVLAGFLLAFPLTLLVRIAVHWLLHRLFGIACG